MVRWPAFAKQKPLEYFNIYGTYPKPTTYMEVLVDFCSYVHMDYSSYEWLLIVINGY